MNPEKTRARAAERGSRRFLGRASLVLAVVVFSLLVAAPGALASRSLLVGIQDDAWVLGPRDRVSSSLARLHPHVLRWTLWWNQVAARRPLNPGDPDDPAYDWSAADEVVRRTREQGVRVVMTIMGTPPWANGGRNWRYAPSSGLSLRAFAYAAARRYSGRHVPAGETVPLPLVNLWTAWNEPNLSTFIRPQFRRVGGRSVIVSARAYARICNAIWAGIHAGGRDVGVRETVACGVTSPRGNNRARVSNPSVSPLVFLRRMRAAGARFDVYAHHPYPTSRLQTPTYRNLDGRTVSLGNINDLVRELTRLYGRKRLWITEYAYQTNPPDRRLGVSWARQARYLTQAYRIARRHPRITMMIWFLVRDEPQLGRWQSGLTTFRGAVKPSFAAFARLTR